MIIIMIIIIVDITITIIYILQVYIRRMYRGHTISDFETLESKEVVTVLVILYYSVL